MSKKVATTIILASGAIGFASFSFLLTAEIGKLHDHPLRKFGSLIRAKHIAKNFDPNKADW